MEIHSQAPQQSINSPKIMLKIEQKNAFGKAYKKREQEPSMFELLQWTNSSLTKHDFKKNRDFRQIPQAYLGQINRTEWTSESKQNYIIPNGNIEVDQSNLYKVQKYIQSKESKNTKKIDEKRGECIKGQQIKQQDRSSNKKTTKANINSSVTKQTMPLPEKRTNESKSQANNLSSQNKRPASAQTGFANRKAETKKNAFGFTENQGSENDVSEQIKLRKKLIEDFKNTTRWIPNSAFTTYFGKPAFQNYGRGNTKPCKGGLIYGTYLYSHNVQPHRGLNSPKSLQSYPVALNKAKSQGTLVPFPPKTKNPNLNISAQANKSAQKFTGINIYPQPNNIQGLNIQKPNLLDIQRFGGTGIQKNAICRTSTNVQQSNATSSKQTQKPVRSKKYQRDNS